MSIKVGINGFGRIGRLVFRAGIDRNDIEFLGINDPGMTPDYMAYMLKYDTMHGQFKGTIEYDDESITVNGKKIMVYAKFKPEEIPWGELGLSLIHISCGRTTSAPRGPRAPKRAGSCTPTPSATH